MKIKTFKEFNNDGATPVNEWNTNSYPGGKNQYFADYQELADYIMFNGEDNMLDISNYGFASAEYGPITALSVDVDANGTNVIFVHFMDDEYKTLDTLDSKDLTLALFSEFIY